MRKRARIGNNKKKYSCAYLTCLQSFLSYILHIFKKKIIYAVAKRIHFHHHIHLHIHDVPSHPIHHLISLAFKVYFSVQLVSQSTAKQYKI